MSSVPLGESQCQLATYPDKLNLLSDENKPQQGQSRKYLQQWHWQTLSSFLETGDGIDEISHMSIMSSKGPRTVPWGTPLEHAVEDESIHQS